MRYLVVVLSFVAAMFMSTNASAQTPIDGSTNACPPGTVWYEGPPAGCRYTGTLLQQLSQPDLSYLQRFARRHQIVTADGVQITVFDLPLNALQQTEMPRVRDGILSPNTQVISNPR